MHPRVGVDVGVEHRSRLSPVAVVWAAPMEDPPDVYRSAPHGGADLDDPLRLGSHP